MNELINYKKSITSQWGEDGIIEEILKRIGTKNKICVEFGAGPGKDLSNTWNLISNNGWRGILIDPNEGFINKWHNNTKGLNVLILKQFVEIDGENSLDNILERAKAPTDIDLASMDIDSDDYHIFKETKKYRPRIVVIEYNPTIPPHVEMVQSPGEKDSYGASAKSIVKLAHEKGYKLVTATQTNCIFVLKEEFEKLRIVEPKIEDIFDTSSLAYLISTYNGSSFLKSERYPFGYSHLYNIYNLNLTKKAFHSISIGLSQRMTYSERLSRELIPVKVFINKNERNYNIFTFIFVVIGNGILKFIEKVEKSFLMKYILKLKAFLKIITPRSVIKKIREKEALYGWYLDGQPDPAPDPIKQKIVKTAGKKNKLKTFIETGTAGGLMIKALKRYFSRIISIELDDQLYENAKNNFSAFGHINLIHGDSGKKLAEILPTVSEPALFWLDAHYSGGGTAKGEMETPIMKELNTIFSRNNKKDVILIDDARCFDGTHDYPTVQQVKNLVANYDYLSFKIVRDIMVIEPRQ